MPRKTATQMTMEKLQKINEKINRLNQKKFARDALYQRKQSARDAETERIQLKRNRKLRKAIEKGRMSHMARRTGGAPGNRSPLPLPLPFIVSGSPLPPIPSPSPSPPQEIIYLGSPQRMRTPEVFYPPTPPRKRVPDDYDDIDVSTDEDDDIHLVRQAQIDALAKKITKRVDSILLTFKDGTDLYPFPHVIYPGGRVQRIGTFKFVCHEVLTTNDDDKENEEPFKKVEEHDIIDLTVFSPSCFIIEKITK